MRRTRHLSEAMIWDGAWESMARCLTHDPTCTAYVYVLVLRTRYFSIVAHKPPFSVFFPFMCISFQYLWDSPSLCLCACMLSSPFVSLFTYFRVTTLITYFVTRKQQGNAKHAVLSDCVALRLSCRHTQYIVIKMNSL